MKRLLLILLLVFAVMSASDARMSGVMLSGAGTVTAGASCTNMAVDYVQILEATDFLTSPPSGWSVTDTQSRLSMSTSGERATKSCPNSTADTGSRGMAVSFATNTTVGYAQYTFATAHANFSLGFWYYTGTFTGWAGPFAIVSVIDINLGDKIVYIFQTRNAVDNTKGFGLMGTGATVSQNNTEITEGAWYWLSLKVVKGGTCVLKIYDANGDKVGADLTVTGGDFTATEVRFGLTQTSPGAITATAYFDDIVFDWTNSADPLGP